MRIRGWRKKSALERERSSKGEGGISQGWGGTSNGGEGDGLKLIESKIFPLLKAFFSSSENIFLN